MLVTGGAGFIGSHLVKRLVEAGHEVVVLDDLSRGSLENLGDALEAVEFVRGDVRDLELVRELARGAEAVVHLAALVDVAESAERPSEYFGVNAMGALSVARAARGASVLVYASSSAVYGEPRRVPVSEGEEPKPKSPYAASKLAGEAAVLSVAEAAGYRPVVLRLFNVYGPRQSRAYAGVISEFVSRAAAGLPLVIHGDGSQVRDFVHVSDVVRAFELAIERDGASGVFNIGSGRPTSIAELASAVLRLSGRRLGVVRGPPRPGDVRVSVADISRARRELGWEPRVSLEEGLRDLLERASGRAP